MPPAMAGTQNIMPAQKLKSGVPARCPHQLLQARPQDQRQHQQLINIERKSDGRHDANQPFGEGQRAAPAAGLDIARSERREGGSWQGLTY